MKLSDPVGQFQDCLEQNPSDIFRCTLTLACHANPSLNIERYTHMMLDWSEQLEQKVEGIDDTRIRIEHLNRFFFTELEFKGNQDDYNNPDNSLVNEVMDTRRGIPVTLAILYMTLGRSIGLSLEGVSFPGHFLVKVLLPEGMVILDAYNGGICLDEQALAELLLKNQDTNKASAQELVKSLESASVEETLMRVLRNLKGIYTKEKENEHLLTVLNMMLSISPDLVQERLDRGLLLHEMECHHVALDDLRHYLIESSITPTSDVLNLVNRLNGHQPAIH